MGFSSVKSVNNKLNRHWPSGKQSRLGHVIRTRERSRTRSLGSWHLIWILSTWSTVKMSSKCVFEHISMLGRVKDSHYSSYSDTSTDLLTPFNPITVLRSKSVFITAFPGRQLEQILVWKNNYIKCKNRCGFQDYIFHLHHCESWPSRIRHSSCEFNGEHIYIFTFVLKFKLQVSCD